MVSNPAMTQTPEDTLFRLMSASEAEEVEDPAFDNPANDVRPGTVVRAPTVAEPMGSVISEVSGPGWVQLYNTRTGEPVKVNRWMLDTVLKKKHDDENFPDYLGVALFSTRQTKPYVVGSYKCLLHLEHPNSSLYRSWGLPLCKAAHLPSPFQVNQHMAKRHKSEWAAIKDHQDELRQSEDRRINQEVLTTLAQRAQIGDAPLASTLPPASAPVPGFTEPVPEEPVVRRPAAERTKPCDLCGDMVSGRGTFGFQASMRKHLQERHPENLPA